MNQIFTLNSSYLRHVWLIAERMNFYNSTVLICENHKKELQHASVIFQGIAVCVCVCVCVRLAFILGQSKVNSFSHLDSLWSSNLDN